MLVICGGVGAPVAMTLPRRLAWRLALAPTFGVAIVAVIVPIAYRFGASMSTLLGCLAVIAVALIVVHVHRVGLPRDLNGRRVAIAWCVAAMILLLPRFVGGDQFAVFQGNQWDTYGYLGSAITYATKPYHAIANAQLPQLLRNPYYSIARGQLVERPSVHELYALFSRVIPGEAYRLYYTYLVWFMAQTVLVIAFVVRNVFPMARPWAWLAIAVAFPLGFWGQYILDINAWSQVASAPLLFAMFGFVLVGGTCPDRRDARLLACSLAVMTAGAVYLYPEGSFIYLAVLIPASCIVTVVQRNWNHAIAASGFAGVVTSALYPPVLHFLIRQVTWSSGNNVSWWHFFQRFFVGRDNVWGDGFARVVDFVASTFGYYFATPKGDGTLWRLGLLIAIAGSIIATLRLIRELHARLWISIAVLAMGPAAYLALKGNYWAAGKVLSYAAPLFVTALALPLVRKDGWRWFAALFVTLQVGAALVRIPAARWHSHSGFAAPYPAIQNLALKHDIGFDFTRLEPYLDSSSKVLLRHVEPWSENALEVFLTARRIPFVMEGPVLSPPGGAAIGTMPVPWTPQVELLLVGDQLTLTYADGRKITLKTR